MSKRWYLLKFLTHTFVEQSLLNKTASINTKTRLSGGEMKS